MSTVREPPALDARAFYGRLAGRWNALYRAGGFKRRLLFVRRLLASAVSDGDRWLDAGCGGGILTLELARLGAQGVAVDGSSQMVDVAERDIAPNCRGFVFKYAQSVAAIDAVDGAFDGVLCSSVIEYVDEIEDTLREFHRVLRVNGTLVVSAPNRTSALRNIEKRIRRAGKVVGLNAFPYLGVSLNEFTSSEFVHQLSRCGFDALEVKGFDPIVPSWLTAVIAPALLFVVAVKRAGA
jgi:2-polyprenyl-6-hydroxyphenyl methylase/3-demethylubiquinone-9 3-methyltransferase